MTMRTLSNGTRSSSATVCATRCEYSGRFDFAAESVTVPSSPMCSQALMSEANLRMEAVDALFPGRRAN